MSGFFFPFEIPGRPGGVTGEALCAGPVTLGGLLQCSEPTPRGPLQALDHSQNIQIWHDIGKALGHNEC